MNKPVIQIKNLNKNFSLHTDEKRTVRQLFTSFFSQGKVKKFQVLKNINLEINEGEFVGIIGRNGSGKSTLLKIISGIYAPDDGSKLKIRGKIVPFLELGVGFNADLTGRENIFLNGTILGMSKKKLEKKFDSIVKFAELEKFIDEPVKNYSSGMLLRLAFSIAIQVEADIYILDEILAVGDENFQRKSISVIQELKKAGKTILFVSHSMDAIQNYCNRAVLLHQSELIADGSPADVIEKYRGILNEEEVKKGKKPSERPEDPNRIGNRMAEIYKVEILDGEGKQISLVTKPGFITLKMHYRINEKKFEKLMFGVSIFRDDDVYITGTNTKNYSMPMVADKEEGIVEYKIDTKFFLDGKYTFTVAIFDYDTVAHFDFHSRMYPFEIRLYNKDSGAASIPVGWKLN